MQRLRIRSSRSVSRLFGAYQGLPLGSYPGVWQADISMLMDTEKRTLKRVRAEIARLDPEDTDPEDYGHELD
jgi:hypothetical protein